MFIAEFVEIEREDTRMPAYAAVPSEAGAASAAIVLAMHLYGVDASIRELARQFAREGFAVIVPDLYARFDAPSRDGCDDPSVFLPFAKRLTFDTVDPDIRASAQWLSQNYPRAKRAIAGVCMGGIMALHRSAGYSDVFSAAAVWYGSIERANVEPTAVDIPIVGSYGGADDGIPTAHVESFRDRLSVPNDILVYPEAGHAFADRFRTSYRMEASAHAFQRSVAFLRKHLT